MDFTFGEILRMHSPSSYQTRVFHPREKIAYRLGAQVHERANSENRVAHGIRVIDDRQQFPKEAGRVQTCARVKPISIIVYTLRRRKHRVLNQNVGLFVSEFVIRD